MAGSVNKVIIIGNLGADPEVRSTTDGTKVANFSVATSDRWKDKATGEQRERTEWHKIVVFNEHLAKITEQYLRKGQTVYIEGQLQTRKWTDQNGVDKYNTEIILQRYRGELTMLGSRNNSGEGQMATGSDNYGQDSMPASAPSGGMTTGQNQPPLAGGDDLDDDIPF